MQSRTFLILLAVLGSLVFSYSCASDSQKSDATDSDNETVEVIENEGDNYYNQNITYKLPSPVELYMFLEENKKEFNSEILNSPDNKTKYYTVNMKTINFGIYVSDLAYATVYGKHQQTFSYFKTTRELADELGFAEGFNKALVKRVENNQYNLDSLYNISNDAYWDACNYLEDQEKQDALALIYTGGWIESVFLAINSIDEFDENDPVVIRIAEQQLLLDNLIGTFYALDSELRPQEILNKLIGLQEIFDQLYDNTEVVITQEQFYEIASAIEALRNELIS